MEPLTLDESARRIGRYIWSERQLFAVLGGWVQSTPEPNVKLLFGAQSPRHAWHAELWSARLPETAELRRAELVEAPCAELEQLVGDVAATTGTLERLVATYRVLLPALVTSGSEHLGRLAPLADGAVERVLRLVLGELVDDWRSGEAILRGCLTTPDLIRRAAEHQADLEVALHEAARAARY